MLAFLVSSSLTEITTEHGERQTTQTHTDEEAQAWSQMEKGTRGLDERAAKQRVHACIQRSRNYGKRGWNAVSAYAFFCSPSRATRNCAQR